MTDVFDPYYDWLGIPPEEQPPTHYRLLGLNAFENKLEAIANAADRQIVHLRTFHNGPYSEWSQKLLNQVAAAKICLLNEAKKADYDRFLRERMLSDSLVVETTLSTSDLEAIAKQKAASKRNHIAIVACLISVGIVCMILFALAGDVMFGSRKELPSTASSLERSSPEVRIAQQASPASKIDPSETAAPDSQNSVSKAPASAKSGSSAGELSADTKATSLSPPVSAEIVKSENVISELPAEPLRHKPDMPNADAARNATKADVVVRAENSSATTPKLAVPSQVVQANISEQLNRVYFFNAVIKSESAKIELGNRLLNINRDSSNPDERFVLLYKAMELACDGGNIELMQRAADAIENDYDIEPFAMTEKMLGRFAGEIKTSQSLGVFVRSANQKLDQTVAAKRYEAAEKIADHIYRACQKSYGKQYRKQASERRRQLKATLRVWEDVQSALNTLKIVPNDLDANLTVGRWHCIYNNDWGTGLPYLEKSADAELKGLAERERLASPTTADAQIELADAWHKRAMSENDESRTAMLYHAAEWYQKALPGMKSTIERSKIVKRLEDILQAPRIESIVIWNSHNGDYANVGTRKCNVIVSLRGKTIWRLDDIDIPWDPRSDRQATISVPGYVFADRLRIEVTEWHGNAGSLAEVQVLNNGINLAQSMPVEYSEVVRAGDSRSGTTLTDGITTSANHTIGYWLLPDNKPGWVEIELGYESKPKLISKRGGMLVIWNTHNRHYADRGTTKCNVRLGYQGTTVWEQKDIVVSWDRNTNQKTIIELPKIRFDILRVEITEWYGISGGLDEIELYHKNKNVLLGQNVRASGSWDNRDYPASCVTDGIIGPQLPGYWLLPDKTPGWVEIDCSNLD